MLHTDKKPNGLFDISEKVKNLPFETILEIRSLAGDKTQAEIGETYGLSKDQVRNILTGRTRRSG
jgi:DNA-directed RNA polymerase sigma subunit (sigma70/sigma32)